MVNGLSVVVEETANPYEQMLVLPGQYYRFLVFCPSTVSYLPVHY